LDEKELVGEDRGGFTARGGREPWMRREREMTDEQVRIIKLHKGWADRYSLMWLGFALLLVTGFQFVLERAGIEAAERTGVMLLLGLIVLLAAIWQAVGLGIARIHMIMKGIDLER
jgi:hypothetical protein